ncbi:MAG: hypothetical protein ACRDGH_06425, partial [Candidatus Limnocylindria bacterium]
VSQAQLDRGYKLTELLKQGLHSPLKVEEQVISIYAGTKGFLDDIPTSDVGRFEAELLEEFRSRYSDLLNEIKESGKLPDEEKLKSAMKEFAERFQPTEDKDEDDKKSGDDKKSENGEAKKSSGDETAEMDAKAEEK